MLTGAAALTAAATANAEPPAAAAVAAPAAAAPIVGLGDSYASGLGAAPYETDSGDCYRAAASWQRHITTTGLPAGTFVVQAACAGATIADIRSTQLHTLTPSTQLVLMSAGGNDAYFTPVAASCAARASCASLPLARDGAQLLPAPLQQTWPAHVRSTVRTDLTTLIHDVHAKAPQASIVLTGYPRLLGQPDGGAADQECAAASVTGMTRLRDPQVRRLIAGFGDVLEQVQQQVVNDARAAGIDARFVSVAQEFTGHSACRGTQDSDPQRWIHGLILEGTALSPSSLHPTQSGQQAYARVVTAQLAAQGLPVPPAPAAPAASAGSSPSSTPEPPAQNPTAAPTPVPGATECTASDGSSSVSVLVDQNGARCLGPTRPAAGADAVTIRIDTRQL